MQNIDTSTKHKNSSQTDHKKVRCGISRRTSRTNHGLLQHLNLRWHQKIDEEQTDIEPEMRNNHIYDEEHNDEDEKRFHWNDQGLKLC